MEFIGIQMHNNLNSVTIESVIAHQSKRSSYNIFAKNWRSKAIIVAPTH
jgi:hypothetical protein